MTGAWVSAGQPAIEVWTAGGRPPGLLDGRTVQGASASSLSRRVSPAEYDKDRRRQQSAECKDEPPDNSTEVSCPQQQVVHGVFSFDSTSVFEPIRRLLSHIYVGEFHEGH